MLPGDEMKRKTILTLLLLMISAYSLAQSNPVFSGDVDQPKRDGTDTVEIDIKPPGTNNLETISVDVEIKKTDTPTQKAKKIADAITNDPDNGGQVTASSIGDQISVVGANGNLVKKGRYSSKTKQRLNRLSKATDGDTLPDEEPTEKAAVVQIPPPTYSPEARIYLYGFITGIDPSGNPAVVNAGTSAGTVTLNSQDYADVVSLSVDMVNSLNAMGISAILDPSNIIVITLNGSDGSAVVFGTDDLALDIIAELTL